jgi:hypothetical protein
MTAAALRTGEMIAQEIANGRFDPRAGVGRENSL